jgi:hypothetical protein
MKKFNMSNEHLTEERRRSELTLLRCFTRLTPQEEAAPRDNFMGLCISEEEIRNLRFTPLNTGEKQEPQAPEEKDIMIKVGRPNYVVDRSLYCSPYTMVALRGYRGVDTPKPEGTLCFHTP